MLFCPNHSKPISYNPNKKKKRRRKNIRESKKPNHSSPFQSSKYMTDVRRSRDAASGRCWKHPRHHQSPGVCSLCLAERLSQLSTPSSPYGKKSSYSLSADCSSSLDSSYCPTPPRRQRHGRLARETKSGPLLFSAFFGGGKDVTLKKSRSMAANTVPSVDGASGKDEKIGRKKLWRFWSKLVSNRKKRRESDVNGLEGRR